jgi:hypothetical protein
MKKNYGFIALRILVFATSIGLALVISFVWHMKDNVKAASAGTTYNTITSPATLEPRSCRVIKLKLL